MRCLERVRSALLFLCLAVMLAAHAQSALAAKSANPNIYLVSGEGTAAKRIMLWEFGSNATFFLPSGFDERNMTISWGKGVREVRLDGKPLENGGILPIDDLNSKHALRYGGVTYDLLFRRSAGVPSLFLTTESGSLDYIHRSKTNREAGTIAAFDEQGNMLLFQELEYIKGRGNSTFSQPKRPYQIKLSSKTKLLGLPKSKRYLLLANHKEKSLIRNSILFDAARFLKEKYANTDAFTDLYINGQYLGTYELCLKVEVGPGRVDVRDLEAETEALNDKPLNEYARFGVNQARNSTVKGFKIPNDPEDITGGYLITLEKSYHYHESDSGFVTRRGFCYVAKSPEYLSEKQAAYIAAVIQELEDAIYAEDGRSPKTGRHFTEMADLDSMVREYLLNEVFKNVDANKSSQYIVKPSDSEGGILYFGPSWDFDLSMGCFTGDSGSKKIASPRYMFANTGNSWMARLYGHQVFRRRAIEMYYEEMLPFLKALIGDEPMDGVTALDERELMLASSAALNFTRWPILSAKDPANTGSTYADNISFIKDWLRKRIDYLDSEWYNEYRSISGTDAS